MRVVIFVGKNHEDASLYFVAKTLQDRIPDSVIIKSASDKAIVGTDLVINLDSGSITKLVSQKRYTNFKRLINFLSGDFYENSLAEKLEIIGHTYEIPLVLHSHYSLKGVTDFCKEWLIPSKIRAIQNNTKFILYGIEDFEWTQGDRNNFIVPYNRVNYETKGIDIHSDITEKVSKYLEIKNQKMDTLFIVSPNISQLPDKEKFPMYRVVEQPRTRDLFRSLIKDRGMFISTSNAESFGIYYLELLCSGSVGIFLDKPWVRSILPDYPFIFKLQDMVAGVISVYENYEESSRLVRDEVVPYIKKTYNLDKFVKELIS